MKEIDCLRIRETDWIPGTRMSLSSSLINCLSLHPRLETCNWIVKGPESFLVCFLGFRTRERKSSKRPTKFFHFVHGILICPKRVVKGSPCIDINPILSLESCLNLKRSFLVTVYSHLWCQMDFFDTHTWYWFILSLFPVILLPFLVSFISFLDFIHEMVVLSAWTCNVMLPFVSTSFLDTISCNYLTGTCVFGHRNGISCNRFFEKKRKESK